MHDGSVQKGDTWLKNKLSSLATWSLTHNSIFLVYFDEDDGSTANRIPVIVLGQHVKANYNHTAYEDHYTWTRTICAMFGASKTWTSNLAIRTSVNDCWR